MPVAYHTGLRVSAVVTFVSAVVGAAFILLGIEKAAGISFLIGTFSLVIAAFCFCADRWHGK